MYAPRVLDAAGRAAPKLNQTSAKMKVGNLAKMKILAFVVAGLVLTSFLQRQQPGGLRTSL